MKVRLILLIPLVAGCAAPPTAAPQQASELTGRAAGAPQRCVPIRATDSLRISENDRHTLVYGSGRTVWANPLGSCGFGVNDVPITEPMGSSYCRGDIVRSFDRYSRIPGPSCVLGDFVPYTR